MPWVIALTGHWGIIKSEPLKHNWISFLQQSNFVTASTINARMILSKYFGCRTLDQVWPTRWTKC